MLKPRFQNKDVAIVERILKSITLECQNMIKDRNLAVTMNYCITDRRRYILILLGNANASEWPSGMVVSLTFLRTRGIGVAIALVRT